MLEQILSNDHMKFFICCAGGHDLAHDFCVPRMKKHYNKLLHGLQSMNIPRAPTTGGGKRKRDGGVLGDPRAAMRLEEERGAFSGGKMHERPLLAAAARDNLRAMMRDVADGNLENWPHPGAAHAPAPDGGGGGGGDGYDDGDGLDGGGGGGGGGGARPLYRICRKNSAAIYRCREFVSEYLFSILGLRENDAFMQGPWRIDLGEEPGELTFGRAAAAGARAATEAVLATQAGFHGAGYYLDIQLRYLSYYIRGVVAKREEENLSSEFIREDYQWIDYIRTHFFNNLPILHLDDIITRIREAWSNDFITEVDWLVRTCNNHFVLLAKKAARGRVGGAHHFTHENARRETQSLLLWLNKIPPPAAAAVAQPPLVVAVAQPPPATAVAQPPLVVAVAQPPPTAAGAGAGAGAENVLQTPPRERVVKPPVSQDRVDAPIWSQPPASADPDADISEPLAAPAAAAAPDPGSEGQAGGSGRTKKGGARVVDDLKQVIKKHFASLGRGSITTAGILDIIFQAWSDIVTWPAPGKGEKPRAYLKKKMRSVKTALKNLSGEGIIIPDIPINNNGAVGGRRWTRGLSVRKTPALTPVMKNFVSRVRQKIAEVVMLWSNADAAVRPVPARTDAVGKRLFHLQATILDQIKRGGKSQPAKDKKLLLKVAEILGVQKAEDGGEGGEGERIITAAKGGLGAWGRRIVINNAAIGSRNKRSNQPGNNSVLKNRIICPLSSDIDGGSRTSIAHQCTYKSAHEVNKNHECGEERIVFRTENGSAAYKFYGTLCNNANTAVDHDQRLNAPKKRITLEITFPNNGNSFTVRTNLEITLKDSNNVQLQCVYFDKVIPAIAGFITSWDGRATIAASRGNKLDIIFDTLLGHDKPITKIIYAKELDKSIGDVGQEFNGYLRGAGYRAAPAYDAGCRAPSIAKYLPPTYNTYPDNEPYGQPPRRLIIANDAPSGARIIWGLKCLEAKNKNMNAYGGFWSSENQYLTQASVGRCSVTAGGGRRRKTRRRKRKPRPTRKRRRRRSRRRARRSRRKRRRRRRKTRRN